MKKARSLSCAACFILAAGWVACRPSRITPSPPPPPSASADATPANSALDVEIAASRALFATHRGRIVISPDQPAFNAVHTTLTTGIRPPERTEAIAQTLGGTIARRQATVVCGDLPSTCTLVGADSYVELSAPRIVGESASIQASRWFESASARQPVTREVIEFTLERKDGAWRVVSWRQISIS